MATTPSNLSKLLASCAKKQKTALKNLAKSEVTSMLALALKCLNHEEYAQEVVIDSFVSFWNHASDYNPQTGSAKGWLYSILRFHIRQTYQTHYNVLGLLHAQEPPFHADGMGTVKWETNPLLPSEESFCHLFEQLSMEQQTAVITQYFSPDSQAIVATRMGMPLGRFKDNVLTGLAYLQKNLTRLPQHDESLRLCEFVLGGVTPEEAHLVEGILEKSPAKAGAVLLAWEAEFTEFIAQLPIDPQCDALVKRIVDTINQYEKENHEKELAEHDAIRQQQLLEREAAKQAVLKGADGSTVDSSEAGATSTQVPSLSWGTRLYYWLEAGLIWKLATVLFLVLFLACLVFFSARSHNLRWVSVLSSTQLTQTNAWVLTVDEHDKIRIHSTVQQPANAQFDFQLWRVDGQQTYHPLGVLNPQETTTLDSERFGDLQANTVLVISLEAKGGSAMQRPSGTIMYKGVLAPIQ